MKYFICLIFICAITIAAFAKLSSNPTAFINVNVIPMDKEQVLQNQTVIVRDGIIVEIGDAKKIKVPKDAIKIDGKGKYLIPGLVDMHAHLLSDENFPDALAGDELKIMVANGVTTARLMIGTPEQLILRDKSAKNEIIAPTLHVASPQLSGRKIGDIFNGYVVTNAEQARNAVRKAKQDGYEFIKLTFFITREVYDAVIDEAQKQNIRVIGHVDRQVGLARAFEAKQQIEHLDSYFEAMIPENLPVKGSTSGVYVWQPKSWESLDILDENKIPELAKKTVESNPFSCPTLTFLKQAFGTGLDENEVKTRPEYRFYTPEKLKEMWETREAFWKNPPTEARRKRYIELRNKLTKAIYEAGGKILTGSDSPDWFLLYGFAVHREMKNLHEAGLPNYAILESATRNPAEFFGNLDKVGTIEKGKNADLVLLDANPLEDISNTEKRAGVMLKGKYYTQTELNGWLDEIAPKFQHALDGEKTQGDALQGFWTGAIVNGDKTWRVNFDIKKDKDNYKALADFIDVDGYGREFSIKQNGETFRLERPQPSGIPIVFEGKINGDVFKGKWSGFGQNAVFSLRRAEPPEKFYREEEVTFKNGDVTLSGSLLLPTTTHISPVVVFTHGGGAETRLQNKSWALHFVRKGFAALIYDKRGTGNSTGDWQSANMDDLANDALAGVSFLKKRSEIDVKRIAVAGHSQGGWVAPLAAAKSKDVAFVITSAASGVSPAKQSIYHRAGVIREAGFSEEAVKIANDLREKLYATGRMLLEKNPNAGTERQKLSAELERYAKDPWFEASALPPNLDNDHPSQGALELLFFDPVPMWEKVKVPVLLVWGDKDIVVPVAEGRAIIENALKRADNKDVTVKIFPNVDHGVILTNPTRTADFPRVDLNYYEAMVDWLISNSKEN